MKSSETIVVNPDSPVYLSDVSLIDSDGTWALRDPLFTGDSPAFSFAVSVTDETIRVSEGVAVQIVSSEDPDNIRKEYSEDSNFLKTGVSEDFDYFKKENEWVELLGEQKFRSLDNESKEFLIKTAGAVNIGTSRDIKKALKSIDDI